MTEPNRINRLLSAIVLGLSADPTGTAPAGILYAGMLNDCTHDEFRRLLEMLAHGGAITRAHGIMVSLTDKGRDLAAQIERHAKGAA